jgi:hypothetical protein
LYAEVTRIPLLHKHLFRCTQLYETLLINHNILDVFISCKHTLFITDVDKESLIACETGKSLCQPIEVVRQAAATKTTVRFLIGSKRTSIQLYDSTYYRQTEVIPPNTKIPIINSFTLIDNYPAFDLTALRDSKYYIHIIGDEVGGIFELQLKTRR